MSALKQNLFAAIDFLVRIESGPDAGKAFRIQPPKIIMGRDPRCQIRLNDPKASRQQLEISFGTNIICKDLSSRKTTRINGKPCNQSILKPGDVISFGQTKIRFTTKTNAKAKPQLPGQSNTQIAAAKEKEKGRKNFYNFMGVIVLLAVAVKLLEGDPIANKEVQLATAEDLTTQIEESKERTSLIREENFERRKKLSQNTYLQQVEAHFIRGFRDYQNGEYSRALDSLGTTLATDQAHNRAQLYAKTAKKKRAELIDTHLSDGQKYKDKLMYNRCAAEFEKAKILINNKKSRKYELANTQYEECKILMTEGQ